MDMKKKHLYRVTVEHLADPSGQPVSVPPVTFHTRNHDDLNRILELAQSRALPLATPLSADESASMVIGLKLLSEIALERREDPFFADLWGHLGSFIRQLKGELKAKPE